MVDGRRSLILSEGIVLSAALFGATLYWFRRSLAQKQRASAGASFLQRRNRSLSDLKEAGNDQVSPRGQTARIPPIPYLRQLVACFKDPCDPIHNLTGYIALCTAENKLITHMLAERCMNVGTATTAFSDSSVFCYNSFLGMPVAREAAAYFLARRFLFPDRFDLPPQEALSHVLPQHVALSAGAAPILNHLFYLLGQTGDACLIPAPYYAAFESDMNVVAGVVPFAVQQANPVQGPTESELDLAFLQARSSGMNPKFLLLTNPNNPLGVIHRPAVMQAAVKWARKRKLHTIVDEIYALSTHKRENHAFESIIRTLNNDLGSDVHMLWGMSKDFGASGLRYGVLYSQNEVMMEGFATLSTFTGVSGPIQYLASEILTDDVFVDRFLEQSRIRLVNSYAICTNKLEEMVLPFIPAEAAMFIYVDFSSLLPQKTFEWERKLSELMFEVRVVLTPGESQHDNTPGMFRICYAWVEPETLEIAMERLSKLVAKVRRMEWDDLSGRALTSVLYS